MWEAVVRPVNPLKLTLTVSICETGSMVTTATPMPAEAFGGTSFVPRSVVVNVIGAAVATPESTQKVRPRARRLSVLLINYLHLWLKGYAAQQLSRLLWAPWGVTIRYC